MTPTNGVLKWMREVMGAKTLDYVGTNAPKCEGIAYYATGYRSEWF